ncbi:MAG: polysaccharide biosynthesis C-terminal domain-containing protein [Holosporaceae bacterium]|nr:MAG: polysaccharide biosynthesis C-terminal domain-containing protein [Holosporaceae bacterium]
MNKHKVFSGVLMNPQKLTEYQSGSVRELFSLAWPLMISIMSGNLMFFTDRWILSMYSLHSMNAIIVVNSIISIFQFAPLAITSISEVFVGQYNGAGRYKEIGRPVWQMLWLSAGLIIIYVPGAFIGAEYISETFRAEGRPYFIWCMAFAYFMPMIAALSGFYAGRGEVKILTISAVISNLVNAGLSAALIFGVGFIPSMGTKGAAIGTVTAQFLNVAILFSIFLKRSFRKKYGTLNFHFDKKLFVSCIKIGLPSGLSHTVEFVSWSIIVNFTAALGVAYVTVNGLSVSFFVLFIFLVEGLQKAVTAICSNLIGASQIHRVKEVFRSALKFHSITAIVAFVPLVLFSEHLAAFFVRDEAILSTYMTSMKISLFLCGFFDLRRCKLDYGRHFNSSW